jgi:hypothetical protein
VQARAMKFAHLGDAWSAVPCSQSPLPHPGQRSLVCVAVATACVRALHVTRSLVERRPQHTAHPLLRGPAAQPRCVFVSRVPSFPRSFVSVRPCCRIAPSCRPIIALSLSTQCRMTHTLVHSTRGRTLVPLVRNTRQHSATALGSSHNNANSTALSLL